MFRLTTDLEKPFAQVVFEPLTLARPDLEPAAFQWLLESRSYGPDVVSGHGSFAADDGESVSFRYWGPAGQAQALAVLLHGACDYSAAFDETGSALATDGVLSLAYDQRGFGNRRSRGRSLQPNLQISDVARASEAIRLKADELYGGSRAPLPLVIIGESMGGGVAVCAAATGLEADGLVLVAPAALACPYRRVGFQLVANLIALLAPWSHWRIERKSEKGLTDAAAIRFLSDPLVLRRTPTRILAELFALAARSTTLAPRVEISSLTLLGTEDRVLSRECVETLYRGLGGEKTIERVPGGSHFLLHEADNAYWTSRIANWILHLRSQPPNSTIAA